MLRHYLTAALGKFTRSPFTTAANVLTLALGLACFIAAYGIATYWMSADTHFAKADRTYVVGQSITPNDQPQENPISGGSTATLARYLVQDFPQIDNIARLTGGAPVGVVAGDQRPSLNTVFVDQEFFEIFDFEFVAGDAASALSQPGSVVLTTSAAERLFGDEPAIGQSVLVANRTDATVTGVIELASRPSFMGEGDGAITRFSVIGHWNLIGGGEALDRRDNWSGTEGMTFLTLKENTSVQAFNDGLADFVARRRSDTANDLTTMRLLAYPVSEVRTRMLDRTLLANSGVNVSAVAVLIGFGLVTLLVGVLNYANLATAQATTRHGEVGMRKVLGAGRASVMAQAWLETLALTVASVAAALAGLMIARPFVRNLMDVDLLYVFSQSLVPIVGLAALVVLVSLIAGAYPALVLSGVRPARAIKTGRSRAGPKIVSRVLVAIQFATASFLLIMLTVTQTQRALLEEALPASDADPVIALGEVQRLGLTYEELDAALTGQPGVVSMTMTDRPPWTSFSTTGILARSPDEAANEIGAMMKSVGYDYFTTLSLDVIAGRGFSRDREIAPPTLLSADPSQPVPVVIDLALARALGFDTADSAVDEVIYVPASLMRMVGGAAAQPLHVLGVTEPDVMRVGVNDDSARGYIYSFAPSSPFQSGVFPLVRLDRRDLPVALESVERAWNQVSPNSALNITYLDELFDNAYGVYGRVGQLFTLLATTAFIISSVGILGIAVHVATRRRHEIAVRKTLGSSAARVVRLLLVDFSKPVLIGNLLAWPLGYFAAQTYLSAFAHRIELTPAPFLISMAITLAIAWAAVIGEVLKAASVRPAEVLRHA
ncbi:MAG: ABC transporter permease [Maricaulaceae bacterium]|jgi:putative ABC transport system permease protein